MWLIIITAVLSGGIVFCLGYWRGKAVANKQNWRAWTGLLNLMEPKSETSVKDMAAALAHIPMDPMTRLAVNAGLLTTSYRLKTRT